MCPCFDARRDIVGRGSGREQTVFATFGSRGACVGEDFSFAVLLFPQTFLFSFVLRLVVAAAFQGLYFFPLRFRISGFVFSPSLLLVRCSWRSTFGFRSCQRCGGLRA